MSAVAIADICTLFTFRLSTKWWINYYCLCDTIRQRGFLLVVFYDYNQPYPLHIAQPLAGTHFLAEARGVRTFLSIQRYRNHPIYFCIIILSFDKIVKRDVIAR